MCSALGASGDNHQQQLLNELGSKVVQVFSECGFDPEQTPDTLGVTYFKQNHTKNFFLSCIMLIVIQFHTIRYVFVFLLCCLNLKLQNRNLQKWKNCLKI